MTFHRLTVQFLELKSITLSVIVKSADLQEHKKSFKLQKICLLSLFNMQNMMFSLQTATNQYEHIVIVLWFISAITPNIVLYIR